VLLDGIVELAEGVAELEAAGEELEALDVVRVVGLLLGERRDFGGVVVDDGGLDEVGFDDSFEEVIMACPAAPRLVSSKDVFSRMLRRRRIPDRLIRVGQDLA
jgi:hypothetical protein